MVEANIIDLPKQTIIYLIKKYIKEGNPDECWHFKGVQSNKYPTITYRKQRVRLTRLAKLYYHDEQDELLFVCHSCDNPSCLNPNHLWLGTPQENTKDALSKGRMAHQKDPNFCRKVKN